jgi:TonB-linked SusC/RagA family outer membrane protein
MKNCCQMIHLLLNYAPRAALALLFCCTLTSLKAQTPVRGTVTGADSLLEGATVTLKGTSTSVQTDAAGHFQINAPLNSTLVITYIGYGTKEVVVRSSGPLAIRLENKNAQLNDIVVVGYGTQKKSDVTGSVSTVKMKDIAKTPSSRIDDALQGRSAGVNIQHTDASPNSAISIRIRGVNSINGGNDPLVVIDGLQGGSLTTLNPEDVQSVEILKDASATAIYGSRGANGVVLVTTKKGRNGKYQVSYNGLFSSTKVRKKIDLMNAYQYATTVNDNRADFGQATVFSDSALNAFKNGAGTDWQDAVFRKGYTENHTLDISGGNDKTSYFLSGNVLHTKGIILNSGYTRYSLRANINSKITDKLTVGVNMFLAKELNHPTYLNGFSNGSPIFSALVFAPTKPIYNPDGTYSQPGGGYGPPTNYNPVALAVEPVRNYNLYTTNLIANADYALLPGLHLNVSGGYKLSSATNNDYVNAKANNAPGTETASIYDSTLVTYQNTNMVTYDKQFHDHHLKVTALMEQQYEQFNGNTAGSIGFLTDANTYNNLGLGNNPQIPTSAETKRSLLSYMGRVNYGYKDLYLLTVTGRADASSVFGANHKWGYFPSVALGWNLGNERFMQSISSLSSLKLRGSYGIVGNQAIIPYQSLALLNSSLPYPINGSSLTPGVGEGSFPNPDLKWEKTAQFNVGFDLSLFNSRLDLTADYYNKKTSDLLLAVPLPMTAGGNGYMFQNVGSVQNRGFEFTLGGRPIAAAVVWESSLTIALNRNKVLALSDGQNEITLGSPGLPNFGNTVWMEVGKPLGEFRALEFQGVWKSSEAAQAASFGTIPGAPKYRDVNKDGVIDNDDKVDIGNAQPKYTFGWSNTVTWKNLDLNIFIQGSEGNKMYNISRVRFETTSGDADATSVKILNRWSPTNENTNVPSFQGSSKSEDLQSTRWLEDGSYVRVKNIALGYTLPGSLFKKKIQSMRIYVSGTNLITFTKYSGFDPEAATGVDNFAGIDLATYPSQKAYTIGLNVNF